MNNAPFLFHTLLHAGDLVEDQLRRRLAVHNLHPRQARILDALSLLGEASQADLAREFNVTAASMSTMTTRLISAGFISRTPDPEEARSNILQLTDRGKDILNDVYQAWQEIDELIAARIGPDKAIALQELTLELRDALGGRGPGRKRSLPPSTS